MPQKNIIIILSCFLFCYNIGISAHWKRPNRHLNTRKTRILYMRTRIILLEAGKLCKIHRKGKQLYQKAIHYQLIARAVLLGRIYKKQKNKLVAALSMRSRAMAKKVIKKNYGKLSRKNIDRRYEKKIVLLFSHQILEREVRNISKKLNIKIPPIHKILKKPYFFLGSMGQIKQNINNYSR